MDVEKARSELLAAPLSERSVLVANVLGRLLQECESNKSFYDWVEQDEEWQEYCEGVEIFEGYEVSGLAFREVLVQVLVHRYQGMKPKARIEGENMVRKMYESIGWDYQRSLVPIADFDSEIGEIWL